MPQLGPQKVLLWMLGIWLKYNIINLTGHTWWATRQKLLADFITAWDGVQAACPAFFMGQ